ncbi:MAG: acetyl-CoA carboxylase carboxyltransferase subunit alpha [Candidatus Sumerlaeia bacterium]|nr:acetyl-CoA carboxylase carboxyltransferase subunit alpha [Candidatus Sumerlaeia bacterium]
MADRKGRPTLREIESDLERTTRQAAQGDRQARRRLPALQARLDNARSVATGDRATPAPADDRPATAWERYQISAHKDRPLSLDYIRELFTEFHEIHGDRLFKDDQAVITGMARFEGSPCVIVGQQKGRDVQERLRRNFGMMHPEGYRKALRVMNMGAKFRLPIFVFIDTKGAFPGVGAEERGQAEAIARNIRDMFALRTPVIVTVIGEGASGGALGVGVGDRVLMLENAWYNVISPEGCAAILWKDNAMAPRAAEVLKLSAPDVFNLGIVDEIVAEPEGGAHRAPQATYDALRASLRRHLAELSKLEWPALQSARFAKYRAMGVFEDLGAAAEKSAPRAKAKK